MKDEDLEGFFSALTKRVHRVNAGQTADAACATWQDMSAALSPIIGTGGFAALYERSLSLTRPAYPWLETVLRGALAPVDFGDLHRALSQQSDTEAAAASTALLQKFCALLARLIGPSLTGRLLRSVAGDASDTLSPQDPTP